MARVSKQDAAKAKEAKQKKIAIGGAVLLVLLLAIQGPKTMKMLNQKPAPPIGAPVTGSTVTPADPNSLAAPTLGGSATAAPTTDTTPASNLVAAVPVAVDAGQIATFERFASKDPFAAQVDPGSVGGSETSTTSAPAKTPGSAAGGSTTTAPPTLTTVTPAAAPPSSVTILLNGESMSVAVGGDFPSAGATFDRVGALFHLVSATAKTAKIAVTGGSYADGAPTITLTLGKPLTLQNTADGTKYTLILEPPMAQAAAAPTTSTTPAVPVVPATGTGG